MVDMGQADASLRMRPLRNQNRMCWTIALKKAAVSMGYEHWLNVPESQDEELREKARNIQGGND